MQKELDKRTFSLKGLGTFEWEMCHSPVLVRPASANHSDDEEEDWKLRKNDSYIQWFCRHFSHKCPKQKS